jgi:hypothetical protein
MTNGVYQKETPETETLEYTLTLVYFVIGFNIIRAVF